MRERESSRFCFDGKPRQIFKSLYLSGFSLLLGVTKKAGSVSGLRATQGTRTPDPLITNELLYRLS